VQAGGPIRHEGVVTRERNSERRSGRGNRRDEQRRHRLADVDQVQAGAAVGQVGCAGYDRYIVRLARQRQIADQIRSRGIADIDHVQSVESGHVGQTAVQRDAPGVGGQQ